MKIASTAKPPTPTLKIVKPEQTVPGRLGVLLATIGALYKKIGPDLEHIAEAKAEMSDLVLQHGEGKGETKTVVVDDVQLKVSPKTTYTMSQDEFRQMVAEFPEGRKDIAFAVVRWKSELDKRRYNALGDEDRGIVDKYVTSKAGKPYLQIKYPGQDEKEDEE